MGNKNSDRLLDAYKAHHSVDLNPVTIVDKLSDLCQDLFPSESNPLQIIQDAYVSLLIDQGLDLNQARQSWVTASGGNFESYLRNHINNVLNKIGIVAIKGDRLKQLGKTSPNIQELIKFLTLPAKRRCTQTSVDVWPDNDILTLIRVNDKWRVLASISAKTSDHSRNTSVLFWALAVSALGIKYFLATQDRDDQFVKPCNSSNVNQSRKLFEAYCDRVFTSNPKASYCSQVKSLLIRDDGTSELTDELLALGRQVADKTASTSIEELEQY
jgi:hypothetical protein